MATQANLDIAQRLDLTCRKGDSFQLLFNVKDSDGALVDFTLFTDFKMDVRETDDDEGTPILQFLNADFVGTAEGTLTASKSYTEMAAVQSGTFVYDLQVTDGNAVRTTWFYGLFTIIDDVTLS
jgi:hypothetical protein